jgi:ligand-binding sensor protein
VWDIFLSHSSADNEFARTLALDLRKIGLKVWFDEFELQVGDSLRGKIEEGITRSGFLAVVLSPNAVKSKWVKTEINAAFARELKKRSVFILPLLCKKCHVPLFLADKVYADFTMSYEKGFLMLVSRFSQIVNPRQSRLDIKAHHQRIKDSLNRCAKGIGSNVFLLTSSKERLDSDSVKMPPYCRLLRQTSADFIVRDLNALSKLQDSKTTELYECHSGLVDFATPVFIGSRVGGIICTGQVRLREPDSTITSHLREREKKYGLKKGTLTKALNRVRKVDESYITKAFAILLQTAREISDTTNSGK